MEGEENQFQHEKMCFCMEISIKEEENRDNCQFNCGSMYDYRERFFYQEQKQPADARG